MGHRAWVGNPLPHAPCPNRVRTGNSGDAMSPMKATHLNEGKEMAVRIRLRRVGRKKQPHYRIVVAESTSPRDGRFVEIIGHYHPRQAENSLEVQKDRANHWLDNGALPSDTVRSLLRRAGVLKARHEARIAKKLQSSAVPLASEEK